MAGQLWPNSRWRGRVECDRAGTGDRINVVAGRSYRMLENNADLPRSFQNSLSVVHANNQPFNKVMVDQYFERQLPVASNRLMIRRFVSSKVARTDGRRTMPV
jgi:hypothetical protein